MVHEFKLTVVHVHAQTRCRSVHKRGFNAGQKTVEKPGLGRGPRAAGPGLRAGGPLAGRGLRAAGLNPIELNSESTIHSRLTLN